MIEVFNTVENTTVFSGNEIDLLEFIRKISIENGDFNFSFIDMSDVERYMQYCDNLKLIQK
jgi:hypothetical protein